MAVIKQISVYEENGWSTPPHDIGAKAQNISLDPSILEQSNVQNALTKIINKIDGEDETSIKSRVGKLEISKDIIELALNINEEAVPPSSSSRRINQIEENIENNIGFIRKEYVIPLSGIPLGSTTNISNKPTIAGTVQASLLQDNTWNISGLKTSVYAIDFYDIDQDSSYVPIAVSIRTNSNYSLAGSSFTKVDDRYHIFAQVRYMLEDRANIGNVRITVTYAKTNSINIIDNIVFSTND